MNETPMDSPEVHPVHAHATGHRWFDYAIGAAALLVSAVSLYVALHHGRTMEKLVQANSQGCGISAPDAGSVLSRC